MKISEGDFGMNLIQELKGLGVNTDEGLQRMGGNASLYERMLVKLKDMMKESPVRMDFDSNDYSEVLESAHSIKGASGNLAVTPIYEFYTEFVKLLREQQPEEAKKILEKALPVQDEIIACIERYS